MPYLAVGNQMIMLLGESFFLSSVPSFHPFIVLWTGKPTVPPPPNSVPPSSSSLSLPLYLHPDNAGEWLCDVCVCDSLCVYSSSSLLAPRLPLVASSYSASKHRLTYKHSIPFHGDASRHLFGLNGAAGEAKVLLFISLSPLSPSPLSTPSSLGLSEGFMPEFVSKV